MRKIIFGLLMSVAMLAQANDKTPVTLVVPLGPGGAVDLVARVIQQPLSRELGRPVVIENQAGAGGDIGTATVANYRQGTMLLINGPGLASNNINGNSKYNLERDLVPLGVIGNMPSVLVVNKNNPAHTVADLGKINYGSSGIGTASHMYGIMFGRATGRELVHVPYKSQPQALNDVLNGTLDACFCLLPVVQANIEAGNVKALAVTSSTRLSELPGVPTLAEQGVKSVQLKVWFMLLANAGANANDVAVIRQALPKILSDADVQQALKKIGLDIDRRDMGRASEILASDVQLYRNLFRDNPELQAK